MLTNVVANGLIIFTAFWLLWFKLNPEIRLRLLNHVFLIDLGTFVVIFLMYQGTAVGTLAASVATIFISLSLSYAKRRYGYISRGRYFGRNAKVNMEPVLREFYARRNYEKSRTPSIRR